MRGLERTSRLEKITDDGSHLPTPYPHTQDWIFGAPFACSHCGAVNIGHSLITRDDRHDPYDAMTNGRVEIKWIPPVSSAPSFGDTPPEISEPALEAFTAWDHDAYRAAILMARAVLEGICKDHGISSGSLFHKIDAMKDADHITKALQMAAHAVRELGNEMAHGDFVKTNPTEKQAKQVLAIMRQFIEQLYEQPAQTARLLGNESASDGT